MNQKTEPKVLAPTRGLWPGVAGVTYRAATYCADCAMEMGLLGPEPNCETLDSRAGVILSDTEWDEPQPECENLLDCVHSDDEHVPALDVRVISYEE